MSRPFALLLPALALALVACSSDDEAGTSTSTSSTSATTTGASTTTGATTGVGGAGGGEATGGGGGGVGGGGVGGSGGQAPFALTSTAYAEGEVIPDAYSCNGANNSPDLAWTGSPAAALSYAMLFTDESNDLVHWAIWDIAASVQALPANVQNKSQPDDPAGSFQALSYDNQTYGYLGPCPGSTHTYTFEVYALDVATLTELDSTSSRTEAKNAILDHDIASAKLTGTFTP